MELGGSAQFVTALDTSVADQLIDLGTEQGALSDLTVDGIAISSKFTSDNSLVIGDVLPLTYPNGIATATVQAIYQGSQLGVSGDFVISLETFDANFLPSQRLDFLVLATLAPGVSAADGRAAIEQVIKPYPTADLRDNAEYKQTQEAAIDTVVNLVYTLLFLAVFIALIGIANTLALSIYERTREIGLLRAVGMSRSQVRSAVRWESVIIAVFGTLLGLAIGLFFGWAVVRHGEGPGLRRFSGRTRPARVRLRPCRHRRRRGGRVPRPPAHPSSTSSGHRHRVAATSTCSCGATGGTTGDAIHGTTGGTNVVVPRGLAGGAMSGAAASCVVLRMSPRLRDALRASALEAGCSLNQFAVQVLASAAGHHARFAELPETTDRRGG